MTFLNKLFGKQKSTPAVNRDQLFKYLKDSELQESKIFNDKSMDFLHKTREIVPLTIKFNETIKQMGGAIIPSLCDALKNKDQDIRKRSCWALDVLWENNELPDEAVLGMIALLNDTEKNVSSQALNTLKNNAKRINPTAVPNLVSIIKSNNKSICISIIEVLGNMEAKATPALVTLRSMTSDANMDISKAAKTAIEKIGGKN